MEKKLRIKFPWSNYVQFFLYMSDNELGELEKMLGAMRNWGKWSVKDDVRLPNIILEDIAFENT